MPHLAHALAHLQHANAAELLDMDRDERRRAAGLLRDWLHVLAEVDRMAFADLALAHVVDGLTKLPDSSQSGVRLQDHRGRFKSGVLAELESGGRSS